MCGVIVDSTWSPHHLSCLSFQKPLPKKSLECYLRQGLTCSMQQTTRSWTPRAVNSYPEVTVVTVISDALLGPSYRRARHPPREKMQSVAAGPSCALECPF